jgi:3-mercaptopyruvate sulfurtransferase SseA
LREFSETSGAFRKIRKWAQILSALGISENSEVILYDDGEMKFASRARFLLYYFGVRRTFMVNGGYNAMERLIEDGRLTETPPVMPALTTFKVREKCP